MKANELRIGNWINCDDRPFQVGLWFFTELDARISYINDFKPIPLTEEWLEKFGFEYDSNSSLYCKSGFDVQLLESGVEFYITSYGNHYKWLEYVHELQNLYFALTGEELTIKS